MSCSRTSVTLPNPSLHPLAKAGFARFRERVNSKVRPHRHTMLDLAGFLTSPRRFVDGPLGLIVGLGLAHVIRVVVGPQVAVELLAVVVALGIIVGLLVGASQGQGGKK